MTFETDIRDRLRLAAQKVEAGDPPIGQMARRGARRWRRRVFGIAASVVLFLGAAGIVGTVVTGNVGRDAEFGAFSPVTTRGLDLGGPSVTGGPQGLRDVTPTSEGEADAIYPEPVPLGIDEAQTGPPTLDTSARVVKTAQLELRVERGEFQESFASAQQVAARYGGFVAASRTRGDEARAGRLTVRIPARQFEAALVNIKRLGRVELEEVVGEDVTDAFVDLRARLRNWRRQEAVILGLMERATSIAESIRVQRELENIQLEIEQIRGQLRVLDDRTDLGTIAITMHEAGVSERERAEPGAFGRAWREAADGTIAVVTTVIVGLGYLWPILLLIVLAWLGIRAIRSRTAV